MRDLARQALHVLDDVPVQLQGFASGVSGQVRVFANTSSITQFLPADLASFTAEHPQVRIQLEESNSPATIRAVAENAADLGVYTAFAHGDHVQSLAYRRDCLCLVVPRQHRLAQTPAVKFLTLEAASAAAAAVPTPAAAAAAPAAAAPAPAPVAAPAGPAGSCSGPVDVECDVLVLGAGPGGYSAAFRTADPTLGESIGMAAEVAHGSCTDLPLQKK